ncbi:MAG: phosphate acyltransferase PlsX [Lachnospiraceae bacterium]|nr:phosphate acyltransferase PlsX [Lachnospiraceae bacterium]
MAKTIVAVDCMGGDNAPGEIVKGAILAANKNKNIMLKLVGIEDAVKAELSKYTYDEEQVEIVPATEVIETAEPPVIAIRTKTDSSLVKAMKLVKEGGAHGVVTAGSTGATLVGGQLLVGRIPGVKRPPLAPLIPTNRKPSLLIDCGANVDAKPQNLVQFAKIGSVYMENVMGVKNPKVAIVNIGAEEEKGNALVKEAYGLLSLENDINFVGNVEARDIPNGDVDVIVCEAFVGNVILKMYEGVGAVLLKKVKGALMSNIKTKIGAVLIKSKLKETLKDFQLEQYGGAPLLGLNGLVVKTHGSSKANEIKNSVLQCVRFNEMDINNKIQQKLSEKREDADN